MMHFAARQYDHAVVALRKTIEMDPEKPYAGQGFWTLVGPDP